MSDSKTENEGKSSCGCGCSFGSEDDKACKCGKMMSIILLALILIGGFFYFGDEGGNTPAMEVKTIEVVRADLKKFDVEVEMAETLDQQRVGLMNRTELAEGKGMLFTYDVPQQVRFWMKDTLIPLDILFIMPDGVIYKIVQGAKPHDETPIPSESAVNAVLEVKAGEVKRMGISVGDTVRLK